MAVKSRKSKTLPIYVLNGPNLNLLGTREPGIYGHVTLAEIGKIVAKRAKAHGLTAVFRQTNHEGELVDWIQDAHTKACGIVINPAAFTHTSVAVLDALLAVKMPIIEVHLSNPQSRDRFRHHSYVSRVATAVIAGLGARGYGLAVDAIADLVRAGA